jgi:preprotein translocase subunit SecE
LKIEGAGTSGVGILLWADGLRGEGERGEDGMFKRMTDSIRMFITDVRAELKKVSFPSRAETVGSTTVVIVFCVIMSLYLSVIDSFLVWLVGKII